MTFFQGLLPYSRLHRAYFSCISISLIWATLIFFLPNFPGATFIQGATLIPDPRVPKYISPSSTENICKCKQYLWTLHNSLFHKLYLEASEFVRNQSRCWCIWPKCIERIVEHSLLKAFVDQTCVNLWTLCSSMLKRKKVQLK